MRVSQQEMDKSHQRIIEGAARLFRERGIENTSVADVMGAANLTTGGFYRHFDSKEALISSALDAAFAQLQGVIDRNLRTKEPSVAMANYRSYYLSEEHLAHTGSACPVAMLAGDVARAGTALRKQFGEGVSRMISSMAQFVGGKKANAQAKAIQEFAMLVGAAVIARASDPETAKMVLAACRTR